MRGLAALFFIGLFPVVVLIGVILYGGITPQILKEGLVKANIYEKLPQSISELAQNSEDENGDTSAPDTFFAPILARMDSSYLKTKTEKLIDDTDMWLKNDKIHSPVISFSEIKSDILAANPDMMQMINEGTSEMQEGEQAQEMKQMQDFIKNDFTFDLGTQLQGLKGFYKTITIAFPILTVLLIISFGSIMLLSKTAASRLKWGGIVLILAAINGGIWALGGSILAQLMTSFITSVDNQIAKIAAPLVMHISSTFIEKFKSDMLISSVAILITGIILLILKQVKGNAPVVSVKSGTAKKKKK